MRRTTAIILSILLIITMLAPMGIFPANSAKATITVTPMIKGGGQHTLALNVDGTVWSWGLNGSGQLGDNTTTNKRTPVQVESLARVTAIASGGSHSLALKSDGTVWSWGLNSSGQLGDNTTTNKLMPVKVQNLTGVIAIAGGNEHSLALKTDGTVWSWGLNSSGQLGTNTTTNILTPVQVQNLTGVTAIASGGSHSLALKSDGTVWSWGLNSSGQLGDNTTTNKLTPVQVQSLTGITAIAGGNNYCLALKSDGTVRSWGENNYGELGDNTSTDRHTPVQVQNLTGVTAIASGGTHSLALKSDGTVRSWGSNLKGQLGNNDRTIYISPIPVQVQSLTGVSAIAGGAEHSLALKSDGTVWSWGLNNTGQLGNNTVTDSSIPVQPLGPNAAGYLDLQVPATAVTGVTLNNTELNINSGATSTLTATVLPVNATNKRVNFTSSNPAVATVNSSGLITASANGNTVIKVTTADGGYTAACNVTVPDIAVTGVTLNYTAVSLIPDAASTLTATVLPANATNKSVYYTSLNTAIATVNTSGLITAVANGNTAIKVTTADGGYTAACNVTVGSPNSNLPFKPMIKGGGQHTLALHADGTVWSWGVNSSGQLGDNSTTNKLTPVQVQNLTGVTAIASGGTHSLALKSDGTVWSWGNNTSGQLGDSTTTNKLAPVQLQYLTGVTAIAAGGSHSLALKSDGTVWSWGRNEQGQLGNNSTTNILHPEQVQNLAGVTAIAGGGDHSLALKSDGTVWSWGDNQFGQLGDNTTINKRIPVQVQNLTGVVAIAGGDEHSMTLKSDGTVWSWGDNYHGQLGDNTQTNRRIPVQVLNLTGVTAIAGGGGHSLALKSDGTVRSWGSNYTGELGDNTKVDKLIPVQVQNLTGVTAIAGGSAHSLALKSDGTVWSWGYNNTGQLGNNTVTDSSTPVQPLGANATGYLNLQKPATVVTGVTLNNTDLSIKPGATSTLTATVLPVNATNKRVNFTSSNPAVATVNPSGLITAVSNGNTAIKATTVDGGYTAICNVTVSNIAVTGVTLNYTDISLSPGATSTLTATVLPVNATNKSVNYTSLNTAVATVNASGVITAVANSSVTIKVTTVDGGYTAACNVTVGSPNSNLSLTPMIKGGGQHTLALKADGTVWSWGLNSSGQLGNNSTTSKLTPVQVQNLTGVTAIAGGGGHSLALKSDGTVWSWGDNTSGQLGDNTTTNKLTPVQVQNLTGVIAIVAGKSHSLALKSDGTVWSWGLNKYGQLGNNSTTNRLAPVQVPNLTGITAIAGGAAHSLALKSDGTVWSWGYNNSGQLGNNSTSNKLTPVQVQNLTGVVSVACGNEHCLALTSNGAVKSWGNNNNGQLGDNTTVSRRVPVQVIYSGVKAIECGSTHSLALISNGTVTYWGSDMSAIITNTPAKLTPEQVPNLNNITAIGSGNSHSLVIKSDGSVWAWGYNGYGQLGDNTDTSRAVPGQTLGPSATGYFYFWSLATGVTLDCTNLTLSPGSTRILTATVLPNNVTNKNVNYTSSNTAVATVDSSGRVTSVAPGNATITVTTAYGGFTAACIVTVRIKGKVEYEGSGTAADPYLIETKEQLLDVKIPNQYYKLANDIDLNMTAIGPLTGTIAFSGSFDGNGKVIRNVSISGTGNIGLFGSTNGAVIKNLKIENIIVAGGNGSTTGSFVGSMTGGSIENCSVSGGNVSGTISGGLIGKISGGTVSGSKANIEVNGSTNAGGLIGNAAGTLTVSNGVATGKIQGSSYAGGIIGSSVSSAVGTISNSYSLCQFNATNKNGIAPSPISITNSYFDQDKAGVSTPGTQARTSTALKSAANYQNWDTSKWVIADGAYPYLTGMDPIVDTVLSGNGSSASPYIIENADQLNKIREKLSACYKLGRDIDLGNQHWQPITAFTGSLDGAGHKICNFSVKNQSYAGLFGTGNGAVLKNINLENINISGGAVSHAGGLIGKLNNGQIENCTVSGTIVINTSSNSASSYLGGIIGYSDNSTLRNSSVNGDLSIETTYRFSAGTTYYQYAGGIIGNQNSGSIEGCELAGKAYINSTNTSTTNLDLSNNNIGIGGLIGYANNCSSIKNNKVTAAGLLIGKINVGGLIGYCTSNLESNSSCIDVEGESKAGGLVGTFGGSQITKSYAKGNVAGDEGSAGGLIGNASATVTIIKSYAVGNVESNGISSQYTGGIIGSSSAVVKIENCFALGNISGNDYVGGFIGKAAADTDTSYSILKTSYTIGTVKGNSHKGELSGGSISSEYITNCYGSSQKAQLTQKAVGFDYTSVPVPVWGIEEGKTYSYLMEVDKPNEVNLRYTGSGTAADPYLIKTKEQLLDVRNNPNQCFKLVNDIDLNLTAIEPLTGTVAFSGSFDGNGKVISNVNISGTGDTGLFGSTNGALIKNLKITNIVVEGSSNTGSLVGSMKGGSIQNCAVSGGKISGTTSGGLIGKISGGTVSGSKVDMEVSGSTSAGGLIGHTESTSTNGTSISNSYASGITGKNTITNAGGLTAIVSGNGVTRISSSYANVQTGNTNCRNAGGLMGYYESIGTLAVENCFSTGMVQGLSYAGGIIGKSTSSAVVTIGNSYSLCQLNANAANKNGIAPSPISITNSYYNQDKAGVSTPATQARTSTALKSAANYQNWDTSKWVIADGSYPYLIGLDRVEFVNLVAPTAVTVDYVTPVSVKLNWGSQASAEKYEVSYNDKVASSDSPQIIINDLQPNTSYSFTVRALNYNTNSPWSAPVSASTLAETQLVPGNLAASAVAATSITLIWDAQVGAENYEIAYGSELLSASSNSYVLEGLIPQTTYRFKVRSKIKNFSSAWSTELTVTAAAPPTAAGTLTDPYLIYTKEDFIAVSNHLSSCYRLERDVDLQNQVMQPIGTAATPFTGNFNGNSHTISNITINLPSADNVALFGYTNQAVIKDLRLNKVEIRGANNVGALIGYMYAGSAENCTVTGIKSIVGTAENGKIIGASGGGAQIVNCSIQSFLLGINSTEKQLNLVAGSSQLLPLNVSNMPRNAGKAYALKYNPADINIIDLAAQTYELNTQPGNITGTGIEIISHRDGVIRFTADQSRYTDKAWNGALTLIKIMPLKTGTTIITFEQE